MLDFLTTELPFWVVIINNIGWILVWLQARKGR